MKLENLEKANTLAKEIENLTRDLRSLVADRECKSVEFVKGGPNVNVTFRDSRLLTMLENIAAEFLRKERQILETEMEKL